MSIALLVVMFSVLAVCSLNYMELHYLATVKKSRSKGQTKRWKKLREDAAIAKAADDAQEIGA